MKEKSPLKKEGYRAAQLILEALATAWARLPARGRVWLAVSGGLDSMVLLEGVARLPLPPAERSRISVVHVNHGLRGAESDGDESLVRERSAALGFPITVERLDWRGEKPGQESARRKREALYASLASSEGDRVFLAHHLNDQAETIFFRLLRGTGIDGLAGMRPEAGRKLRPLLRCGKGDLKKAALFWGISWREDSSNLQSRYERNWLRLELFPLLEARRPGFEARLAALADEAAGHRSASSPAELDLFSFQSGVWLARPRPGCAPRELKRAFSLGRHHSQELAELLRKTSGRLEAEGVRFFWSQKVLLAEKGKARLDLRLEEIREGCFQGSLGTWEVPAAEAGQFAKTEPLRGEAVKKEFQKLRVPIFFRAGIPVLARQGRPLVLLPGQARIAGLHFEPSPLAAWWLEGKERGLDETL